MTWSKTRSTLRFRSFCLWCSACSQCGLGCQVGQKAKQELPLGLDGLCEACTAAHCRSQLALAAAVQ